MSEIDLTHLRCPILYLTALGHYNRLSENCQIKFKITHLESLVETLYILELKGAKVVSKQKKDTYWELTVSKGI
jgi:TusA-related sulfurtransferase